MKKFIIISLAFFAMTTNAIAQEGCGLENEVSVSDVLTRLTASCCTITNDKRKNRCFNGEIRRARLGRSAFGKEDVATFVSAIRDFKANACASAIPAETCENSVGTESFQEQLTGRCCGQRFQDDRKDCLTRGIRSLRAARKFFGADLLNSAREVTRELRKASSCGAGGKKVRTGCNSFANVNDGFGGALWKPFGDHTALPVWLLPDNISSNGCVVIDEKGKELTSLNYTGRANGNREHHRSVLSCKSMPDKIIVRCNVSSQNLCYRVNGPCNRND